MKENKSGPGRKTRDIEHATATQILEGGAIPAARLISDLIRGVRKRISPLRYNAAVFNLEQCLGKARQKIEHSGGVMTYGALAKSAEDQAAKSPELFIDVDKIGKN